MRPPRMFIAEEAVSPTSATTLAVLAYAAAVQAGKIKRISPPARERRVFGIYLDCEARTRLAVRKRCQRVHDGNL